MNTLNRKTVVAKARPIEHQLNSTDSGVALVALSQTKKEQLRKELITFLNSWGPYEYYITISAARGVTTREFQKALRRLLKGVNRQLFGHAAEPRTLNHHLLGKASVLLGYLVVENSTKSGNRCQLHTHITCRTTTGLNSVGIDELFSVIMVEGEKVVETIKGKPAFNLKLLDIRPIIDGDSEGKLAKYNTKHVEWHDQKYDDHGPGLYAMLGRKLERLF